MFIFVCVYAQMMVVLNLFSSDRKVIATYEDKSGDKDYPGFVVGTGDDDTVLTSFFVDKKLVNVYASLLSLP